MPFAVPGAQAVNCGARPPDPALNATVTLLADGVAAGLAVPLPDGLGLADGLALPLGLAELADGMGASQTSIAYLALPPGLILLPFSCRTVMQSV